MSFANAYCAETDVERYLQFAIEATSKPTSDEAGDFGEGRATVLTSLCSAWGKAVAVGATSGNLTIMLREANAIGAALDYILGQEQGESPSTSDKIEHLQDQWVNYVGDPGDKNAPPGWLEQEIKGNLSALAINHILSGDTSSRPVDSPTPVEADIGRSMDELF